MCTDYIYSINLYHNYHQILTFTYMVYDLVILSCIVNITMLYQDKNTADRHSRNGRIVKNNHHESNHRMNNESDSITGISFIIHPKKNDDISSDEISGFLSKIHNKYSGNAEQKHLNQLYDIGILCVNKSFNRQKLIVKITKIIEERSHDSLKNIRDLKKSALISAFKKGIEDGLSDDYRAVYDSSNRYQYDSDKLKKRARIDNVLNNF